MAKILILPSKTGGGHISLAEALADKLTTHEVKIIDPQPAPIHWHYSLVSRHALWLWAAEFKFADTPARALAAHRFFALLLAAPLRKLIREFQPQLIISTYPFLTYEVQRVLAQERKKIPFAMFLSDPNGVHNAWLTEHGAAATFAPTHEDHAQALAAGLPSTRLHLSGWIVRDQFYRTTTETRAKVLHELNLEPQKFTVFLQGGGEGAAKFSQTVESVLAVKNVQVILAAGTNKMLQQKFSGLVNLRVLPFTKHIAPYMAAAEVVMGKAGPNMLFEAVTLGKPFIATAYIPGQEEVNLQFIDRHQLGGCALEAATQRDLLESLIAAPQKIKSLEASVQKYQRWNNERVETIAPILENLLAPPQPSPSLL